MTTAEVSNRIDYALSKSYGGLAVDEYNKSLYATRAQALVVDKALATYEYGDNIRHILGKLLVEKTLTSSDVITAGDGWQLLPLDSGIKQIVYEVTNSSLETIPMDYNDIHEILKSPFRKPNEDIAYRVTADLTFKLYTSETLINYFYVYCKTPKPIVLENMPSGLTVQGVGTVLTSELPYDTTLRVIDVAAHLLFKDKAKFAPRKEEKTKT